MTPVSASEFEIWKENRVTRALMQALANVDAKAKREWWRHSWEGDPTALDHKVLMDARARSELARDIQEMTLDDLNAWAAEEEDQETEENDDESRDSSG